MADIRVIDLPLITPTLSSDYVLTECRIDPDFNEFVTSKSPLSAFIDALLEGKSSEYLSISGGTINGSLNITGSVSSVALSGTFYGDGSKLLGFTILPNQEGVNSTVTANSAQWGSVYSNVNVLSSNWDSVYNNVNGLSSNWSSVYDNVRELSGNNATFNYLHNNFFPITGGVISGLTRINNNLTVVGNFSATGTTTFSNTVFSTTSALSVIHIGDGPALYVGNNGTGDIASFYDIDQNVEILHVGGNNGSFPNVGVKTSFPNTTLTVNGEISANNVIYSFNGSSTNWNQAATTATTYRNISSSLINTTFFSTATTNYILDSGNTKGSDIVIGTNDNFDLQFETNGQQRYLITKTGLHGINTFNPNALFTVNGTISSTNLDVDNLDFDGNTISSTNVNGSIIISPNGTGNVGINNISPNERLTVSGNITASGRFYVGTLDNNTNSNTVIVENATELERRTINSRVWDTNATFLSGTPTVNNILRLTSNNTVGNSNIFQDSNNNIGIGTTTPFRLLTVSGEISANNVISSSNGNSNQWNNAASIATSYQGISSFFLLQNGNLYGQDITLGTNDNFNVNLKTNNTTRAIISNTGAITVTNNLSVAGSLYNDEAEFINKLPVTSALTAPGTLYVHNGGATSTSITCNSQQLFLVPIWVPTDCVIDQAGVFASTNAASVDVKVCIYEARFDGRPTTRIGQVINVPSGTTGGVYVASSISPTITLKRGNYYAGIMGFGSNVALNRSVPGNLTMGNGMALMSGIYRLLPGYYDMQGGHLITAISSGQEPPSDLSSRPLDTVNNQGTGVTTTIRYRQSSPFVFFKLAI